MTTLNIFALWFFLLDEDEQHHDGKSKRARIVDTIQAMAAAVSQPPILFDKDVEMRKLEIERDLELRRIELQREQLDFQRRLAEDRKQEREDLFNLVKALTRREDR